MKDETRIRVKAAIVEVLNDARRDTSLSDLLTRLRERGVEDETSIKAAVWQLVAEGDIELTPQRTLRIPGRYRPEWAPAI